MGQYQENVYKSYCYYCSEEASRKIDPIFKSMAYDNQMFQSYWKYYNFLYYNEGASRKIDNTFKNYGT